MRFRSRLDSPSVSIQVHRHEELDDLGNGAHPGRLGGHAGGDERGSRPGDILDEHECHVPVALRFEVADDAALRLGQGDFTLAAWVYEAQRSTGATHTLLCKRGGGNTNGWYWGITGVASPHGPGKVGFVASSGADPQLASIGGVGLSNWTHVAVTYQAASQTAQVFLNGVLDNMATGFPSPSSLTTNALQIGSTTEADPAALDGALDEVRIYRRALSSDEIWQLYGHRP